MRIPTPGRPSPAMVVALIALFVALSGVGYAVTALPKNSVKSKQIKDGQVKSVDVADNGLTGTDINESSLTGVPSGASTPSGPAGGDLAGTYPNPTVGPTVQKRVGGSCVDGQSIRAIGADGAVTCEADDDTIAPGGAAGGDLTGSYPNPNVGLDAIGGPEIDEATLSLPAEPFHEIGAAGEPGFGDYPSCFWKNYGGGFNTAGFARDRSGFVHLKGRVDAEDGRIFDCNTRYPEIFRLPAGYRPASRNLFVNLTNGALGRVDIGIDLLGNDGAVLVMPPTTVANAMEWVQLDGISFRCAPSGADGCP